MVAAGIVLPAIYARLYSMSEVQIRRLREADVPAVAELFEHLARATITIELSAEGAERLLSTNDAAAIARYVDEGFDYWVAEASDSIIGFVGMRDNSHLYHLFVAEAFQRRGIARRLWETAKQACRAAGNPGRFTVNSSNYAVGVYEAFGFRRVAPMQNVGGVLYWPMLLECSNKPAPATLT
jgi:ribosomal protein S18 acetylase RimI-like enzyme